MDIFVIIISVFSIVTILGLLIKPKIGSMLYMVYMYFAPWFYIGGFQIYRRTLAFVFLGLTIFQFKQILSKKKLRPLMPFIIFLLLQFIIIIFAEQLSFSTGWYMYTLCDFFFVMYLYANMTTHKNSAKLYKWTLFWTFLVITAYGLFLISMPGINPYKMIQMPLFGGEFNEAYAAGNSGISTNTEISDDRMFGRISSVFDHPMTYGLNLGFFAIFSTYLLKDKPKWLVIVLAVIITAIVTSGIRTPIAALLVTILFALLYIHKAKYFWYCLIGATAVVILLPLLFPSTEEYVMSIFSNDEDTGPSGSSLSMRLGQLEGCIELSEDTPIFGKGYGWHTWYNNEYGPHMKALYFESLIFTILVDTGFVGFIIWAVFIIMSYKFIRSYSSDRLYQAALLSLIVFYLAYGTITGDMGIKNMLIFFVVMLGMNPDIQKQDRITNAMPNV